MIGLIIFFIIETKSDIVFATFIISQFIKNRFYQHNKTVNTIFQYLKAIKDTRIIYRGE